jgi:uncharacterized membrane protein
MIPTIGVMIGVYILMRCAAAIRDSLPAKTPAKQGDITARGFFNGLTIIVAVIAAIVGTISIVDLIESGSRASGMNGLLR